jgi:uncharacterized membrane protein YraQ (UPF0718 family)
VELLGGTGPWLLIGIAVGGTIAVIIPDDRIRESLGSGWRAVGLMLLTGIPLYVCATGSIPIAAALMLKGMSPGAAFVFLLTGPATNAVAITFVVRYLGKIMAAVHVGAPAVTGLIMGAVLDLVWTRVEPSGAAKAVCGARMFPGWLMTGSAVVLVPLIGLGIVLTRRADARR